MRQEMAEAAPGSVIAFVNDHFDMYWMDNMPTFAVGVSATHYGPSPGAERWLQLKRRQHPGHPDYGRDILRHGIAAGFDLTRSGPCEFNHNVLIPKKFIWPDRDIPVVPIMINCFSPPLRSWQRCHALGRMVCEVIERRPERVALMAALGDAPAEMLAYEAVKPWMGGVGLLTYRSALARA